MSQAVRQLSCAYILEIVDHRAENPGITVSNTNSQCTATILYQMYIERGIGYLSTLQGAVYIAAIVSDTLMFSHRHGTTQDPRWLLETRIGDSESFAAGGEAGSDLRVSQQKKFSIKDPEVYIRSSFGVGQYSMNEGADIRRHCFHSWA